jgi:hypothetical protein
MKNFNFSLPDELAYLLYDQLQIALMRYTERRNKSLNESEREHYQRRMVQITELLEKLK